MMRIATVLFWIALILLSAAYAADFVQYQNPFANGSNVDVGPDGTVWFRNGSQLIHFDPQGGVASNSNLPSSYPGSVAVDTAGAVWVFCGNTICRVSEGMTSVFSLMGGYGSVLAAAPDGSVWASGSLRASLYLSRNILARCENGSWQEVADKPSTKPVWVMDFEEDGTGWFAFGNGLARYENDGWEFFENDFLGVQDMAVRSEGEVWVCRVNGVSVYQDGALVHEYGPADGLAGFNPGCVDVDVLGRVWVGDWTAGLSMFDGTSWSVFTTTNSGLPSNEIADVAASPDGSVFTTTRGGLARYSNGLWSAHTGEGAMVVNNDIWSVAVNELGQVFYGTYYGEVGYGDRAAWEVLYRPGHAGIEQVFDIAFGTGNSVWLACQTNLKAWKGHMIDYAGMGLDMSKAVLRDPNDNIWVGSRAGVARYGANMSWTSWPGGAVSSLAIDLDGRTWAGRDDAVIVIEGDAITNTLPQYSAVAAVTCDQDGLLWFGFGVSERGVLEFDGTNEIAWYTTDDGLPGNRINCIACDSANHIWVGTNDGLAYFDRSTWTKYNTDSGFAVNEIRDIFAAPNGDVWFATPAGLLCRESGVQPPKLSISIATDRPLYHAGETMTVSLSYHNPGPAAFIDIQVACQLPDGSLFYYPGGDTPVPYSSGMLPSGASIPMVLVLTYEFPSGFPVGGYTWMTAMFQQGTFNMVTDIATAPFTFE